jgi:hypothetical protein
MKQIVLAPINTIALDNFQHKHQFVGMKYQGDKYIAVPSSDYAEGEVTFTKIDGKTYFSSAKTLKDLIRHIGAEFPVAQFFVFDNAYEMALWIHE